MQKKRKVIVIGAGFGGISAAAYLARSGYDVTILEKNPWIGGRAQVYEKAGFRFDMGPSWYLLAKEFDKWFEDFHEARTEYYKVDVLAVQYKVFFSQKDVYTLPSEESAAAKVFETIEPGAGKKLERYLKQCKQMYEISLKDFIYVNFNTIFDLFKWSVLKNLRSVKLFSRYRTQVRKTFKHRYIHALLEYPTVFLGSSAKSLPAVYTLMNWVDFGEGAMYPQGGYSGVAAAMKKVAEKQGVKFLTNAEVSELVIKNNVIVGVKTCSNHYDADIVVANADYHWIDQMLTPAPYRYASAKQWDKKKLAPSTLNFYLAFNTKIPELEAHTFFFDSDWDKNFDDVYQRKTMNEKPLFYVHVPSRVDTKVAPKNGEAVFVLIPIAPGVDDNEDIRKKYLQHILNRMEEMIGRRISGNLAFYKSYSVANYTEDYHAFKGTAFGLGQTLFQTASFRPPNKNKRIKNLYYTGQYTIPGTGVSMAMIGGKVVAERIIKENGVI